MNLQAIKRWANKFRPKARYLCVPTAGLGRIYLPIIGLFLTFMGWQILADSGKINPAYLPSPGTTAEAFVDLFRDAPPSVPDDAGEGTMRPLKSTEAGDSWLASTWDSFTHTSAWRGTAASVTRIMKAVGWACLIGLPLGILMGAFGWIESIFKPLLIPLGSLPISALLSLFALFYMLNEMEDFKVTFLTFGTVVYVIPTTLDAVRNVRPEIIDKAVDLGFRPMGALFYFVLPAALPRIYEGVRICTRIAWSYVIMAETYHVSTGLGATIANAQRFQNAPKVYAGLFLIILLTALTEVLYAIPPRLTPVLRAEEAD